LPGLGVFAALVGLAILGSRTNWFSPAALQQLLSDTVASPAATDEPEEAIETTDSSVRFPSAEAVGKSGIQTKAVEQKDMSHRVPASGTLDYNRARMAHLATRAPGYVWRVYKQVGDAVRQGDVLGLVDAAEVGRAKTELLQALRSYEFKAKNLESLQVAAADLTTRSLRETEAVVAEARLRLFNARQALLNLGLPIRADELTGLSDEQLTQRVRLLGLPESVTRTLDPNTATANLVPLIAPFDGVIIGRDVSEGEVVNGTAPQFVLADVRRLWVTLDVRQEDIGQVRPGQRVTFRPDGRTDLVAVGDIAWISTEVDDKTRTVRVRAEVDNADGRLRARSFGRGQILIEEKPAVVAIPRQAVQWEGNSPRVFVLQSDGRTFEARPVRLGIRDDSDWEAVEGLRPGEVVVTIGSHVLQAEINRNRSEKEEK
jgi:cobalt-zinc-cadmium efflux system membrane fusion protein